MNRIGWNHYFAFFLLLFAAATSFSIALTQIALTLAMILWIGLCLKEKKKPFPRTPLDWFFVAWLALEVISTLFSPGRYLALEHFIKRALLVPIVYLIAGSVQTRKQLRRLLLSLLGVMTIVAVIGIVKYHLGPGGLEGRLKLFNHYMTSGGLLMINGLLALAFVFSRAPQRVRLIALAAAVLMFFPLIYTYTRSSWLGYLAGFTFIILFTRWKFIFALIPAVLLAFWAAPSSLQERLISVVDPWHPNNIERTYMWQAGVRMVEHSPLYGYGDSEVGKRSEPYKSPQAKERGGHLHNNLIMFAVILGIPGLLVILGLFIRILATEWITLKSLAAEDWLLSATALGALAAFIGFQINGLFEWNFGDAEVAMLMWLTVGLSLAAGRIRSAAG
ncbi:MAG: O-Antigen ligase [bacterium ADurb.Bin478]|nr:MAG: O-Antigen ligase [bacterium ADurb.Bin478]